MQKGEPIYVLSSEKSIEFIGRHRALLVGKDPIIAVHDLHALAAQMGRPASMASGPTSACYAQRSRAVGFAGVYSLSERKRQSADLEALVRAQLRREGFLGAVEIILHH